MSLAESTSKGQGSRSRAVVNSPIVHGLRTRMVVNPLLISYEGILYDDWKQTKGSVSVWIMKPGRSASRIRDIHRHFVRQTVRSFDGHYKMGRQTGQVRSIWIFANSVKVDLNPNSPLDLELKLVLLTFLKSILGDNNSNRELQHFYKMIQNSTTDNFWLLEYHPILMSIMKPYHIPTDCHLGL